MSGLRGPTYPWPALLAEPTPHVDQTPARSYAAAMPRKSNVPGKPSARHRRRNGDASLEKPDRDTGGRKTGKVIVALMVREILDEEIAPKLA